MIFITEAEIARIEGRIGQYPFSEICSRILENSDYARHRVVTNIKRISAASNLFVIQNVLLESYLAYVLTKDSAHLDTLRTIVKTLTRQNWRKLNLPEEIHCAWVLNGLCVIYDLLMSSLNIEEAEQLKDTIDELASKLWQDSLSQQWGKTIKKRNAWNHTIVSFSAIGNAGLVLSEHPQAQTWMNTALRRVQLFFDDGITEAGMTREGLAYCGFVFRNLGLFLRAAENLNYESFLLAQYDYQIKLRKIINWYASELFPRGKYLQNYNDSYWEPHHALWGFLMTFGELDPDLTTWIWERLVGASGLATFGQDKSLRISSLFEALIWHPGLSAKSSALDKLPKAFFCVDVGYFSDRDGWSDSATIFSFNCGKYIGGIHDQADNNSFTLMIKGIPFIIDAGAANKPVEKSPSSSYGHNVILIDEKGQYPSGAGNGVTGILLTQIVKEDHSYIVGDVTESYNRLNYNPVNWAVRHCYFIKYPVPCLIIYDDINKDERPHNYELLLHVPQSLSKPLCQNNSIVCQYNLGDKPIHLAIKLLHPTTLSLRQEEYISKNQAPFQNHYLWRIATLANNPYFVALIMEHQSNQPFLDVTVKSEFFQLKIDWAEHSCIDTIIFPKIITKKPCPLATIFPKIIAKKPYPLATFKREFANIRKKSSRKN